MRHQWVTTHVGAKTRLGFHTPNQYSGLRQCNSSSDSSMRRCKNNCRTSRSSSCRNLLPASAVNLFLLSSLLLVRAQENEPRAPTYFGDSYAGSYFPSRSDSHEAVLIPTFQATTEKLNTRMVFTQVLNDAYNGGTDGLQKATYFSEELSNNVDYTGESMEKFLDMLEPLPGVASLCFPTSADEIPAKCSKAYDYGDSVYIPITQSTTSPTTSEAYSSGLWTEPSQKHDREWYESIRLLKKQVPKLKVYALYNGKPDDRLLHYLLGEYRLIFEGLLLDWEFGPRACWTEVEKSPPDNNWMWFVKDKTRYLMANQDPASCLTSEGMRADKEVYLNSSERDLQIQDFLLPVFPCYNGSEWRCHSAIKEKPAIACDDKKQRYAFALYEITSASTLRFFLKTCQAAFGKTPSYDLVQVL